MRFISKLQKMVLVFCFFPVVVFAQSVQGTEKIVRDFYDAYNAADISKLAVLIDDARFVHQMNYEQVKGKDKFLRYIAESKKNYSEPVKNYIVMVSDDGRFATTKFVLHGKYLATDDSAIPAHGQNYTLSVLNFFEIQHGKIVKASAWFDEKSWEKQVRG